MHSHNHGNIDILNSAKILNISNNVSWKKSLKIPKGLSEFVKKYRQYNGQKEQGQRPTKHTHTTRDREAHI